MADVPPDIAVSSAQAGFAAREFDKVRKAHSTGQVQASNRQVKSLDEASATVDTTDGDTAVFSDSEGTGSQGRSEDQESDDQQEDQDGDASHVPNSKPGDDRPRLDIEA